MTGEQKPSAIRRWLCTIIRGETIPLLTPLWHLIVTTLEPLRRWLAGVLSILWQPVSAAFSWFWTRVVPVLWLCAYALLAAVAVALIFIFNDQGQDLLRISAEFGKRWWNIAFLCGAILLGFSLWYASRVLLARDFLGRGDKWRLTQGPRTLLPRLLGASVPFSIGIGYLRVSTEHVLATYLLGGLFIAVSMAMFWLLMHRRQLALCGRPLVAAPERGIKTPMDSFGRTNWILVSVTTLLALVLTIAFVIWPVGAPRILGAPAIVVLAFAGIALFGSLVLTYWPLSKGQPGATALVLILAVGFGYFNDNHWIRTTADTSEQTRPNAAERLERWRAANPTELQIEGKRPVIIVAAAGGGIRAAYWTATTLATLESIPGFAENLFAISGVSGGSVGAAVYAAVKREQLDQRETMQTLSRVRAGLGQDFLSPVLAGLLFPDLMQRFAPAPFSWADRQRFLELGFERALPEDDNPLSRSFMNLYTGPGGDKLSSLLLNTTIVGSGRRAVISNIRLDGFTDTVDLMAKGFSTRNILLSAAAGASARFTYVSPAGTLEGIGSHGPQEIRVVDGGYFENSGAATADNLLDQLNGQAIYPILVLIRNDPAAPPVCAGRSGLETGGSGPIGPPATRFLAEIASPIRALLNARTARGRLAEVDAAKRIEQYGGAVIEISLATVLEAELAQAEDARTQAQIRQRMIEPPLGWSLSQAVREKMDTTLEQAARDAQQNPANELQGLALEIATLRAKLNPESTTAEYTNCRAR